MNGPHRLQTTAEQAEFADNDAGWKLQQVQRTDSSSRPTAT
jgi:hypothetical protein